MTTPAKAALATAAVLAVSGAAVAVFHALTANDGARPVAADPTVDHGPFDHSHGALAQVLEPHVRDGLVDYAGLAADPSGLRSYLSRIAAVDRAEFDTWSEAQQLAMLINLYNAATLNLVVDHYPVDSIKDIGGLFRKPWSLDSLTLFGKAETLDHVEHDLLREEFDEPRIHFAIVCAALGCPPLRSEPYTAATLDAQLDGQGREFLADPDNNRVEPAAETLYLSRIFKWFAEDFGGTDERIIEFVRPFLPPADAAALRPDFRVRFTDYDWDLNDLKRSGA